MNARLSTPLNSDQRTGLPAWTYHSPALTELEKKELFATHWQIAGHVADIPEPGDFIAFDFADERALVLRDGEGKIRAFHNLCRHRGARVVADSAGQCPGALVCPFHGWVYNLDGSLRGPARPSSFGNMDRDSFGLIPMELEIWHGFLFVRARAGPQPPVADLFALIEGELAPFRMETLLPAEGYYDGALPVNWKSVRDVDNEGYHVAMAHPALQDLYGEGYRDEPLPHGVSRTIAPYNRHAGRRWSVRNYRALAQPAQHLPDWAHERWAYYGLFPNNVIGVTPESVQFFQEFPLDTRNTKQRGRVYRFPEESRRQRAARYLALRIDRETYQEDIRLSVWSDEAMRSSAFPGFHLSDLEIGVRAHHDGLRQALPVVQLDENPGEGQVAEANARLSR